MISNREDWLAQWAENGLVLTDHLYLGQNRLVPPGTYTPDWDAGAVDTVTFLGTARDDTLLGGGGEFASIFLGTRGDDLYGGGLALGDGDAFYYGVVDYSGARSRVVIDMDYTGSRTFTDEDGQVRSVSILGRAVKDGYGGQDDFMEGTAFGGGYSSVTDVIGSRFGDTMVGFTFGGLYGGGGNDRLTGNSLYGGDGNDVLRGDDGFGSVVLFGDSGNDRIFGTDGPGRTDVRLVGGEGNDRIFAGAGDDRFVTGDAGNDYIDGGAGNDFIDGGVGKDVLLSGAGNDDINPDVEFFQSDPSQPRDGARDVIRVTRDDLGDFTDNVLQGAFEADRDVIHFKEAVKGGLDYRIIYEARTASDNGFISPADQADLQNTVLQIDWNRNGFGEDAADRSDYFLVLRDVTLTEECGWMLT
jgi:Ca2+-binding RTX toxin-like protein